MPSTLRLRPPSGPVRVINSSIKAFWPWLVASAAIHGLLVLGWLNLKLPDAVSGDVVIELAMIDVSPEKPAARPVPAALSAQKKAVQHRAISKTTAIRQPAKKATPVITALKKTAPPITRAKTHTQSRHAPSSTKPIQLAHNTQAPPKPVAQPATPHYASRAAKQVELDTSRLLIRNHLESFKYYPASARRRGIEGHVEVAFRLTRHGAADEVAVLHGSGYAVLDHAALETVYRAQPFPVENGKYRFSLRFKRL